MKLLFRSTLALSVIFFAAAASIQAQDDRTKVEFYGGYSYLSTDTGLDDVDSSFDSRLGSHGFDTSLTGNVHRYVGIQGDFSYHSKSEGFTDGADHANVRFRTTQFLGGVQFKDNKVGGSIVRPFVHMLAGVAHQSLSANGYIAPTTFNESLSTNNFALALGAGVDVRAGKHIMIRVIKVDYNPIFYRRQDISGFTIDGRTQNNVRIGAGLVFN